MAQRIIHYLFGDVFSKQIKLKDKNRFLIGSVMPDAYKNGCDRDKTHYKIKTENEIYFDFNMFREQYLKLILQDDLYLGYYMHLVEDAFYRQFIYNKRIIPNSQEEVAILHKDYHTINLYLVNKYHLENVFNYHVDLKCEPISNIADFKINEYIEEMSYDFIEQGTGKTYIFKENMADEFLNKYLPLGLEEVQNIYSGKPKLQANNYTWTRLV